jgi:hypothetical protein
MFDEIFLQGRTMLRLMGASLAFPQLGTGPRPVRPARAVLALDRDRQGTWVPPRPFRPWEDLVVSLVSDLGPLPVMISVSRWEALDEAAPFVRFVRRLRCPVHLLFRVGPFQAPASEESLSVKLAHALVDAGLTSATLPLGGLHPLLHHELLGGSLEVSTEALRALLDARDACGTEFLVRVEFPCVPIGPQEAFPAAELRALEAWARQVDVDAFEVVAPFVAPATPLVLPEALSAAIRGLEDKRDPFQATRPGVVEAIRGIWAAGDALPGAPRQRGRCPVEGLRLEFTAEGLASACPFHPPCLRWGGEAIGGTFPESDEGSREAIRGCVRLCAHPSLSPPWTPIR